MNRFSFSVVSKRIWALAYARMCKRSRNAGRGKLFPLWSLCYHMAHRREKLKYFRRHEKNKIRKGKVARRSSKHCGWNNCEVTREVFPPDKRVANITHIVIFNRRKKTEWVKHFLKKHNYNEMKQKISLGIMKSSSNVFLLNEH